MNFPSHLRRHRFIWSSVKFTCKFVFYPIGNVVSQNFISLNQTTDSNPDSSIDPNSNPNPNTDAYFAMKIYGCWVAADKSLSSYYLEHLLNMSRSLCTVLQTIGLLLLMFTDKINWLLHPGMIFVAGLFFKFWYQAEISLVKPEVI